jgi:hypothetical protein
MNPISIGRKKKWIHLKEIQILLFKVDISLTNRNELYSHCCYHFFFFLFNIIYYLSLICDSNPRAFCALDRSYCENEINNLLSFHSELNSKILKRFNRQRKRINRWFHKRYKFSCGVKTRLFNVIDSNTFYKKCQTIITRYVMFMW